jgi:hypothetical protein
MVVVIPTLANPHYCGTRCAAALVIRGTLETHRNGTSIVTRHQTETAWRYRDVRAT